MRRETLRTLWLGTALAMFGLASIVSPSIEAIQSDKPVKTFKIEDLVWLSGDWETASGRVQIDEHWTKVAGGSLIGMSRTVAGGRTVFFEYLRIEARGADIFYVAHPKARNPGTDFKLVKLNGQEAVFENPAHDFPKRIIYRKNGDGSLTARRRRWNRKRESSGFPVSAHSDNPASSARVTPIHIRLADWEPAV